MPVDGTRVLVVEDDTHVAAGIVEGLREAGFHVHLAATAAAALRGAIHDGPHIVVLDLMLPDGHGFDVLRTLGERAGPPVIVLTAQSELDERVEAFKLGAVDFVPKPFFVRELIARIDARLRTGRSAPTPRVLWADAELDIGARLVTVSGKTVTLTEYEHDLLVYLATRARRAVSRAVLADVALDPLGERDARTVDSHVARLRRKLGAAGAAIVTVWGIGYRFDPGACG